MAPSPPFRRRFLPLFYKKGKQELLNLSKDPGVFFYTSSSSTTTYPVDLDSSSFHTVIRDLASHLPKKPRLKSGGLSKNTSFFCQSTPARAGAGFVSSSLRLAGLLTAPGMLSWGGSDHHAHCDLENLAVRAAQSGVEWDLPAGHLGGLKPEASGCSERPGSLRSGAFSLDLQNLSDVGGLVTHPVGSLG